MHVAVRNYDVICIKGEVRSAQADGWSSMWMLITISTKEIVQKGITMMDRVFVYGYVCIGLMGCALLGLIIFTCVALKKFHQVPCQ
jgi:hypothetical protein